MPNRMTLEQLASLRHLLGIDESVIASLRRFHQCVNHELDQVVDSFYVIISSDQRARAVVSRVKGDVERLRKLMRSWLDSLLLGPHDSEAYLRSRLRIGDRHVQVGLPQDVVLGVMAQIRQGLLKLALVNETLAEQRETLVFAICKVIDLELAILLESHRQSLLDRLMATERLSTIGQLVASIGHELRNPLSTIETSAYLLAQKVMRRGDEVTDPAILKNVEKIRHQVRVATKTVSDLLELAKNRAPRKQAVLLGGLVHASAEGLRLSQSVQLEIGVDEGLTAYADLDQLRIVIVNLLSNALDAVAGNGSIRITAKEANGGVSLWVIDDGPGIEAQARERIFQALYTTKPNGNGLGLPLCRRIAESHGGALELEPSDRGATFHLWLPGADSTATSSA